MTEIETAYAHVCQAGINEEVRYEIKERRNVTLKSSGAYNVKIFYWIALERFPVF